MPDMQCFQYMFSELYFFGYGSLSGYQQSGRERHHLAGPLLVDYTLYYVSNAWQVRQKDIRISQLFRFSLIPPSQKQPCRRARPRYGTERYPSGHQRVSP